MDTVAESRIDSNSESDYHALLLALLVDRINECYAFFVANLTLVCLVILLSRTELYNNINCPLLAASSPVRAPCDISSALL